MQIATPDRLTETPVIPVQAPPPPTPGQELRALERLAWEKGTPREMMDEIRRIGDSPDQVQIRIVRLRALVA